MPKFADGWMTFENGRIYLSFPQRVVASKDTPNGTKVYWIGNHDHHGTSDGPCISGQCVGIFQYSEVSGASVQWDEQCQLHNGGDNPEKVGIDYLGIE